MESGAARAPGRGSLRFVAVVAPDARPESAAPRLRLEVEALRLALAQRRYDAYAVAVLAGTLRALASRVVTVLRARSRRAVVLALRGAVDRVASHGSRRRAALRALVRRRGRPVPPYEVRRYRQYYDHTRPTAGSLRARVDDDADGDVALEVVQRGDAGAGDLSATLASVRAQCYDRIELVVVASEASVADRSPAPASTTTLTVTWRSR